MLTGELRSQNDQFWKRYGDRAGRRTGSAACGGGGARCGRDAGPGEAADGAKAREVVRGELAAILALAQGAQRVGRMGADVGSLEVLCEQVEMVAGTRSQLDSLLVG